MTTWRDVERVRAAHPDWSAGEIATDLGCMREYVTATARRRGWTLPSSRNLSGSILVRIPRDPVTPLCRDGETPHDCMRRLIHKMLVRENARVQRC